MSDKCYIFHKECELWQDNECLAVFKEQCPYSPEYEVAKEKRLSE